MNDASIVQTFREMELFRQVPPEVLSALTARCRVRAYPAGTVVFRKGEPGDALFLILSGAVKIHDGDYAVAAMGHGQCIGEIALVDEGPRSMSVTVTEEATLARVAREDFFAVFEGHPQIMRQLVGLLTGRLRLQTDQLVQQLKRREDELNRLVEARTAELQQQTETARKLRIQAEIQMQEAERQRRRAEQSEQAEQQFLANMSHEIRTPMNAVIGMTRLLLLKSPRPDQLPYLTNIRQASESLLVILNDILDISKIQAGRMELERTSLSVTEVLERVAATLRFKAEEKGLEFRIKTDPDIPAFLTGDPVRLQQVITNLAGNAIKFTERGSVAIRAERLPNDGPDCRLHFSVQDTGIGMTSEQLNVVFESFRQASGETTRKYGGTGLGLSISKQLVELMGGHIEASSTPGAGSTFRFEIALPAATAPRHRSDTATDHTAKLRGLRILVAEDNAMNRIVAEETLAWLIPDVHVQTAENGREAVDMVQNGHFDVVLMDVHMPEMDGMEATRAIRQLPVPAKAIPVVAFTASVTRKDVQLCYDAGMNGCIPKPFKDEELLNALLDLFDPGRSASPASPAPESDPLTLFRKQAGDKPERLKKYIDLFIQSASANLTAIRQARLDNDILTLHRAVHTVKPQLKMLNQTALADLSQRLEDRLKAGNEPAGMEAELNELIDGLENAMKLLTTLS
ncbi:MAG: ATP-binding protein [Saprospiraceae bacterium]|nr:ATP-binding protein [Saprospiraceae bacterium]